MKTLDLTGPVGPGKPNHSHDVKKVQRHLNRHADATHVVVQETGVFDSETLRALENFQRQVLGMRFPDGTVGLFGATNCHLNLIGILAAFGVFPVQPGKPSSITLTAADYAAASKTLSCEPEVIQAVATVETNRSPFDEQGRPSILFERHVFSRLTKHIYDKTHPEISNRTPGGYGKFSAQYGRIESAYKLDRQAAIESASWGAFQVMGFNHAAAGYGTALDMVQAMCANVQNHLKAFVQFVKQDSKLLAAVQKKAWASFALHYNGKTYAQNQYDTKMAAAYAALKKAN